MSLDSFVHNEVSLGGLVAESLSECKNKAYLNAFIEIDGDRANKEANRLDNLNKNTDLFPLLSGSVISIKDNFLMSDTRTTAGSKMLENFTSPYNSTVVEQLQSNNAIIIGKTNMDEFGMGSSGSNSAFGASINPWSAHGSLALTTGGSSSGSAAAVASYMCHASIGSDTGGSIRQPASYCGIVGLKPTYGTLSRHGLISYASSMDTPSILTRSVTDAAIMLDALSCKDPKDPSNLHTIVTSTSTTTSTSSTVNKVLPTLFDIHPVIDSKNKNIQYFTRDMIKSLQIKSAHKISLSNVKIGIPDEFNVLELDDEVRYAWQETIRAVEDLGATVQRVSIPSLKLALPCYYVIACAEASSNLSRYDGIRYGHRSTSIETSNSTSASTGTSTSINRLLHEISQSRAQGFGSEVLRRVLTGSFVLSQSAYHQYFATASTIRLQLRHELKEVFQNQVHLLLGPTVPILPFPLATPPDAASMLLNDVMTVPANLAGCPAISIPVTVTAVHKKYTSTATTNSNNTSTTTSNVVMDKERVKDDEGVSEGTGSNRHHPHQHHYMVPIGMQLMGPLYGEAMVLRAALGIEQQMDFRNRHPLNV